MVAEDELWATLWLRPPSSTQSSGTCFIGPADRSREAPAVKTGPRYRDVHPRVFTVYTRKAGGYESDEGIGNAPTLSKGPEAVKAELS